MPYVFDVYGTLLDVDAAAREAAQEPGIEALQTCWPALATGWRQRQLSYSWLRTAMDRYVDFWTITQNALDVTLAELDLAGDATLRDRLLALYTQLSAYNEVPTVLAQLAARDSGMAVLSNGSPTMLDSALGAAQIAPMFDQILSVDAIEIYKPNPAVYRMVTDAYGCAPHEVVFFSSNHWDVAGAGAFGFTTIWVNRAGKLWDELPERPHHIVPDLTSALQLL